MKNLYLSWNFNAQRGESLCESNFNQATEQDHVFLRLTGSPSDEQFLDMRDLIMGLKEKVSGVTILGSGNVSLSIVALAALAEDFVIDVNTEVVDIKSCIKSTDIRDEISQLIKLRTEQVETKPRNFLRIAEYQLDLVGLMLEMDNVVSIPMVKVKPITEAKKAGNGH